MKLFLTIGVVILLLFGNGLFAQQCTVMGKIVDNESGEALIGAIVKSGDQGTSSNNLGQYILKLSAGNQVLELSYVGYNKQTIKLNLLAGETKNLDISMVQNVTLLQTTTVTTSKYETPLAESTVSLEVIQPSLLESISSNTVDEVLNKVPSVNIIDGQANIRGGSGYSYGAGSRVLLLIDDMPALQADAGYTNWSDVPVENIEQIEVVKGASSALYGSAAMNGIINIRTGYARSKPITKAAVFATALMDPDDPNKKYWKNSPIEFGAQFSHKQKFDKLDLVLGGFFSGGDEYIKDTYTRYVRLTTGLRYRFTDRFSISLNTNFNKGKSQSFFLWQNKDAGAYIGDTNTVSASNKLRYFIDPSMSYFDKYGNHHKVLTRLNSIDNQNSNSQSNKSNSYYFEYQFQRDFKQINAIFTAGVTETYSTVSAELYGSNTFGIENRAIYGQLDKKIGKNFTISTGLRYEYNDIQVPASITNKYNKESKPVVRAGVNYKFGQASYLRASFGQGYRFPTIAEKFIQTTFSSFMIFPNDTLRSETGWSSELGLKQGFKISDWYGFFDIAGFWTQYNNMMEFTLSSGKEGIGFRSLNVGNTIIKGIDVGVAAKGNLFGLPTSLFSGYTYLDPQFATFGKAEMGSSSNANENILKYRFRHSLKFDAETKIKRLSVGLSCIYNSNMEAIDRVFDIFIKDVSAFRSEHKNGFAIFDVRSSYEINESFKATMILANVFNTEYSWRPARLEPSRNITLRLDYKFN